MIARAALAIGFAWLVMPHHPDLGLAAPAVQPGDSSRQAILSRLREVRSEIETQKTASVNLVWNEGREAASQKAGRLPDKADLVPVLVKALRTLGG